MIGNNTILGYFEAIVVDDELQILINQFWSSVNNDPEYFQNVVKDRENNEIRYNHAKPGTLGREIHEEVTVVKLEDYLKKSVDRQINNVLNEIDEFIESNPNKEVETFLKLQYHKLIAIEGEIDDSKIHTILPTFQFAVQQIKDQLINYSRIYELSLQTTSSYSNAGRPPLKNDEFFVEHINTILAEARKDKQSSDYFHCIHRSGPYEGQPNYREIARNLFNDHPELSELYSSDEGLQKRIKKVIETYELI